jgi:outer membrane lipoprotein-sorting protein
MQNFHIYKEGKINLKYILIVVILSIIVGGGILAYQYWWLPKQGNNYTAVSQLNIQKTKIGTLPEGYQVDSDWWWVSNDGKELFYIVKNDNQQFVVINGKAGKAYEAIRGISRTPDGKRIIYSAQKEGKWILVDNGRESKAYDHIYGFLFSPDGKRVIFKAEKDKKMVIVVDEKESKLYDQIRWFNFSPDSKQVIFEALKIETINNKKIYKSSLVIDNEEGEFYDNITLPGIRDQGSDLFSYYNSLDTPSISQVTFFLAETEKHSKLLLIRDGKKKEVNRGQSGPSCPVLSSDGQKMAYVIEEMIKTGESAYSKMYSIVSVDENTNIKEGKKYRWVSCPVFSLDSNQMAYLAMTPNPDHGDIGYPTKKLSPEEEQEWMIKMSESLDKAKCSLVLNGIEGKSYDCSASYYYDNFSHVDLPFFSPDGKKIAYRILTKSKDDYSKLGDLVWGESPKEENQPGKCFVVAGDKESKIYDYYPKDKSGAFPYHCVPFLSPDSSQVVYLARNGEKEMIVSGEKEGKAYDDIILGRVAFSPDSKKIAYIAEREGKQVIVVNEKESDETYDRIRTFNFSSDSKYINFSAKSGNDFWWIVGEIK